MPIALDGLPQLIREHEQICREEAELAGRRKEALKRLKSELGVNSVDEASELVEKLIDRRERIAEKYAREYKRFKVAFEKHCNQRSEELCQ